MLVIRLARTGKKKQAYFRIVVAEKERAVGAKFIEVLGNYNPHLKLLEIKKERIQEFLNNGAQPSNRVALILKKEGISLPGWVKIKEKNKPAKKAEKEKSTTPAEKSEPKEEVAEPELEKKEDSTESPSKEETSEKEATLEDKN